MGETVVGTEERPEKNVRLPEEKRQENLGSDEKQLEAERGEVEGFKKCVCEQFNRFASVIANNEIVC